MARHGQPPTDLVHGRRNNSISDRLTRRQSIMRLKIVDVFRNHRFIESRRLPWSAADGLINGRRNEQSGIF